MSAISVALNSQFEVSPRNLDTNDTTLLLPIKEDELKKIIKSGNYFTVPYFDGVPIVLKYKYGELIELAFEHRYDKLTFSSSRHLIRNLINYVAAFKDQPLVEVYGKLTMLRDRYFKLGAKLGLRPSNYDIKSVVENVLLLNDIEFNKDLAEKLRDSLYFIPKVAKGFHNKSHLEQIRMLYQIWRVKSISTPRSLFSIEDLYHFWRSSSWRTSLTNFDAKGLVILSNENSSWEKYELPFPKNVFYAKIITIQSRTSISGLVTPIALIDARSIFGEGLMQADLIDFDNVLRLDIRERDLAQVHIQSGGKVTVVDIVSDARVDNALVIKTPTHCSSCNHKLEIISNALRRCPNTQYCPEQIVKRFRAQISDILYPSINLITDSFIHNLIFEHQINTPERLLELSDEDLKELANTNGSSMIRILDSAVKKARKNPNQVSLPMHLKIFVSGELSDSERELLEDLSNKTGLRVSETLDSSLDAVLVARQSDTKHISQARRLQVPLTSIDELVDHVKLIL